MKVLKIQWLQGSGLTRWDAINAIEEATSSGEFLFIKFISFFLEGRV